MRPAGEDARSAFAFCHILPPNRNAIQETKRGAWQRRYPTGSDRFQTSRACTRENHASI